MKTFHERQLEVCSDWSVEVVFQRRLDGRQRRRKRRQRLTLADDETPFWSKQWDFFPLKSHLSLFLSSPITFTRTHTPTNTYTYSRI